MIEGKEIDGVVIDEVDDAEEAAETAVEDMEARIKLLLEIYPVISPTMLQAGLGPQIPPAKWRPVLEKLLATGEIRQAAVYRQSVSGRNRNYIRLGLRANMDAIVSA